MSENVKLRFDLSQGRVVLPADADTPPGAGPMDDAEAQMRRALGLDESTPRSRPEQERNEPALPRSAERFSPAQRRRFVQDGEVPVTVIRREATDGHAARQGGSAPSGAAAGAVASRLQRAETALAAEAASRERAERALQEAQATIRDLRTKLGHAELARTEVQEQARREREALAELRAAAHDQATARQDAEDRARAAERQLAALQAELAAERLALKDVQKALQSANEARQAAERMVEVLSEEKPSPEVPPAGNARSRKGSTTAARRGQTPQAAAESEPEPVKWWLPQQPKAAAKRR